MATSVFNVVTGYGADNSGATDSTAAFQNAINAAIAAGNAKVYIPAGFYQINSSSTHTLPGTTSTTFEASIAIITNAGNESVVDLVVYGDGSSSTFIFWSYTVSNYYSTTIPPTPSTDTAANLFGVVGSKVEFREFTVSSPLSGTFANTSAGLANARAVQTVAHDYGNYISPNTSSLAFHVGAAFYFVDSPSSTTYTKGLPGGDIRIENVSIDGTYIGIHFDNDNGFVLGDDGMTYYDGSGQAWLNNLDIANTFLYGIIFNQFGGNVFVDNCEISGGNLVSYTYNGNTAIPWVESVGMRICLGDGYQISNGIFTLQGFAAFVIQPNSDRVLHGTEDIVSVVNVFCSQVQFDVTAQSVGAAAFIEGLPAGASSGTFVAIVEFVQCHFTGSAGSGLYLQSCSQIQVSDCSAYSNQNHGLFIDTYSKFILISGGKCVANSQSTTTQNNFRKYDGIYVSGDTTDFSIIGVDCSFTEVPNIVTNLVGSTQRFGITVGSNTSGDMTGTGNADRYTIADCDVSGYTGALTHNGSSIPIYGINDRGNGYDKRIHHNRGHNPLGIPPLDVYVPPADSSPFVYAFQTQPTPMSGTIAANAYGIDATVYVSAGSSALTIVLAPQTNATWGFNPTFTVPANSQMVFRVPANSSIKPSWTTGTSPTWTWVME